MTESFDFKLALNLLNELDNQQNIQKTISSLESFIKPSLSAIGFDDVGYEFFLSQLISRLCVHEAPDSHYRLLIYATEHARADSWLELLIQRISCTGNLQKHLKLLTAFFLEFRRLPQVYQCLASFDTGFSLKAKTHFLTERIRSLINLPVHVANALKAAKPPRLFVQDIFYRFILSCTSEQNIVNGILLSQLCLLGHGQLAWKFILHQASPCKWNSALVYVPDCGLESSLLSLLSTAEHPKLVREYLFKRLVLENEGDQTFLVFHRLLLLRVFSSARIPVNIFGCLGEAIVSLHIDAPSRAAQLISKVDNELGLRLLRAWADETALRKTSAAQRLYLNQALVAWVTYFRTVVKSLGPANDDNVVSEILSGISMHLSSNLDEQKIVGMAVGEWLIRQFQVAPMLKIADTDPTKMNTLKFDYIDNEAVTKIRPLFEPMPPHSPSKASIELELDSLNTLYACTTPLLSQRSPDLDSDDDPDDDDGLELASFVPLPKLASNHPDVVTGLSSLKAPKPHYLRECLDGLAASPEEAPDVALASFAHAEDLIYQHRSTVTELALPLAEALLHTEPPACPYPDEVNACRHRALVAVTVVAPRKAARYLTGQFAAPGLAVNQRYTILSCLTDAACNLAASGRGSDACGSGSFAALSSSGDSNTRRFCSKPISKPQSINPFAEVAGYFFFPLLACAPRLGKRVDSDPYAHLDDALLSRLIAALGCVYACARTAPQLARMADSLISTACHLLEHKDPAVRRSSLSALGVVVSVTPESLFVANPGILLNDSDAKLARSISKVLKQDTDQECKQLAGILLSSLQDQFLALTKNLSISHAD